MNSKKHMLASGPKVRSQQKIFIILVLNVTQPVDFIILKPQWKKLLKEPSIQVFVASERSSPMLVHHVDELDSRNHGVIENIFMNDTNREPRTTAGIFLLTRFSRGQVFKVGELGNKIDVAECNGFHIPRL